MPLGTNEIPGRNLHRLCVRCRKWHRPGEGRDYVLPRVRPWASEIGRAMAGIGAPSRFMCAACDAKRVALRRWLFGILAALVALVVALRMIVGA